MKPILRIVLLHAGLCAGALAQSPTWTWAGDHHFSQFGYSVSGAGDVNRDGFADVIVGAAATIVGTNTLGEASVHSGRTGQVLWSWVGDHDSSAFGYSVSGAGDIDGDGFADIVVGAPATIVGTNTLRKATAYSGRTGQLLWSWVGDHDS